MGEVQPRHLLVGGLVHERVAAADRRGTTVDYDAWAGATYFDGALMIAGPKEAYYRQMLEQETSNTGRVVAACPPGTLTRPARRRPSRGRLRASTSTRERR